MEFQGILEVKYTRDFDFCKDTIRPNGGTRVASILPSESL